MPPAQETKTSQIVQLHTHSEYSLVDGALRISELIDRVKSWGHKAVALTDHNNMHGAIEFYLKAKDAGIKPILGAEIYHEGNKETLNVVKELKDSSQNNEDQAFHLVLLARSFKGYKSLIRIVSYGYLFGLKEIPIVPENKITGHTEDLICLSSCLKGEFAYLVQKLSQEATTSLTEELNNPTSEECTLIVEALKAYVKTMHERFGKENFYIELIDNNLEIQKATLPHLVEVANFFSLPIVATSDAHYLDKDFMEAHVVLTAIKNDLTISKLRNRRKDYDFHLYSDEEMKKIYAAWPEAIANTGKIADACDIEIPFGEYFLPEYQLANNENIEDALRRLSKEGLQERLDSLRPQYGDWLTKEQEDVYWKRLEYELDVIISMGFPGYFLIVQDFINWAKDHEIPVGPGRGSGAGSLVAYALRITDLDPIPLNLIFERFLNPERVSMPDFDVDFCQSRRDEVISYVVRKYGAENVGQITTFGKMKAKAAIRDVGRVLEVGYTRVDKIAKLIPNELDIKLKDALSQEPRILEEAEKDDRIDTLLKLALKIEGLNRHSSVHAAGVVISNGGLENYVPIYKNEDNALITQYEMKNAEKAGLVKFDFLGLKTLTVVKKAVDFIRGKKDPNFLIENINTEDKTVYKYISSGHTVGIFQLESSGMKSLVCKLKPSCFEDIIAVVALFRPGPLGSGMVDDFIERKHGIQEITYSLPELEPILQETYGIILYQEQVQKIAATLANYSLGEADLLRRAMGKKKPEEMAKQKVRFLEGSAENKIDEKIAEDIFDLMAKFASYGFNKSHSAAYGLISYQTAFLKTHYPEYFMAAIMTCDLENTDKIIRYIEECRRMKFKILPPDINRSDLEFDVPKDKTIGFGLAAIKGIGEGPLLPIISERKQNGPFKSLTDLSKRVNLHQVGKKNLEILVEAGAFDSINPDRGAVIRVIPEMVKYSENSHNAKKSGQRLLFANDDVENEIVEIDLDNLSKSENAKGSELLPIDWLLKEQKLLGVFISNHPVNIFTSDQNRFSKIKIAQIPKSIGAKNTPIVAFLANSFERISKSGRKLINIRLEDNTGSYEGIMYPEDPPQELPPTGSIVVAYCSVKKGFEEGSVNLRVESIMPLENARREMVKKATIDIKANLTPSPQELAQSKALIHQIQNIIANSPGTSKIIVKIRFKEGSVTLNPKLEGVDLNDRLYQSIMRFQPKGVELIY